MDKLRRSNTLNNSKAKQIIQDAKSPRESLFSHKAHLKNQKDKEKNKINKLIQHKHKHQGRGFSQSLLNPYTPLTIEEKEKVFADMNEISINRFKHYNNIFDQIKQQISDINNSLYESGNESYCKRPHKNTIDTKQNTSIKEHEDEEEKEGQHYIDSKYISKTIPIFNYDIDEDTLDENVNVISVKNCAIHNSSKLLLSSCRLKTKNLDWYIPNRRNKMLFIEARTEYKKRRMLIKTKIMNQSIGNGLCSGNKTFNVRDFYYEPSIASESNFDKKEIPVKYCNCLIV